MKENSFISIYNKINTAVKNHLIGLRVKSIVDRGEWVRHHYEVTLSNNNSVFFKLITHPEWACGVKHEYNVVNLLRKHELPSAKILAIDDSCQYIDYPFLIQEKVLGRKLGDLLDIVSDEDKLRIYRTLGSFYKRLHSIKGERSGLWDEENPMEVKYPISPNDYMFNAEITNGSGKMAYDKGLVTEAQYDEIIKLWTDNMEYLKNHEPSMVHISAFYWNIYLEEKPEWEITKILSLGDVMWWDTAYDIATLKYPPFGEYDHSLWNAFLETYGKEPDEKRILLYSIMHKLCAAMGGYMEPEKYRNKGDKSNLSKDLNEIISRLKRL